MQEFVWQCSLTELPCSERHVEKRGLWSDSSELGNRKKLTHLKEVGKLFFKRPGTKRLNEVVMVVTAEVK